MKKQIKNLLFLTIILFFITSALKAQTVNIDAVVKYWELTDSLKQNKAITDKQWDEFINLEGNKTYVHSVFDSASLVSYRKALEIVYMPKNDAQLQKNLKANFWYCVLIKRYKDREAEFKNVVIKTILQPGYFDGAYQLVYEYLPKKAHHPVENLKLYYNCLGMDAVSYPNGLFFSLMAVANNWEIKKGTLEAHELHHRLRLQISFKNVLPTDEGLVWALASIQNEGIPDMVDKYWSYNTKGDPEDMTGWLITPAAETIKTIDSNLVSLSKNQTPAINTTKQYRKLLKGTVGHMPGFYMANIIVGNGYKKQMIATSDDPFEFIYLYNKAALKDVNHPFIFSKVSIDYLKALQKKIKVPIKSARS